MSTSRADITRWFESGINQGATHLIVVCDTFDYGDYPVYVKSGEDPKEKASRYGANDTRDLPTLPNKNMQKVMEVYCLSQPLEEQINKHRVFNFS